MPRRKTTSGKLPDAESFSAVARILQWFFSFPDNDWTLTEVCEQTGTAKKTASPLIEEFIKKRVVIKNEFGRSWRLMSNVGSPFFVRLKIASNLGSVYNSGIVDQVRSAYPQAKAIVLFGSFRKGEDKRASDLDIAVEINGVAQPNLVSGFRNIPAIGYRPNVRVNLLVFSRENIDINLFSNIMNGIVLDGFLEARP